MIEVAYLFNTRYLRDPVINRAGLLGSRPVLIAIAVVLGLQLLFTYAPPLQVLFDTRPVLDPLLVPDRAGRGGRADPGGGREMGEPEARRARLPGCRVTQRGGQRAAGGRGSGMTAVVSISTLARSSISALTSTTAIAG